MPPKRTLSRRWTADELLLLRQLTAEQTVSDIARRLNRTTAAVRTKAAHERLPLREDVRRAGRPSRSRDVQS